MTSLCPPDLKGEMIAALEPLRESHNRLLFYKNYSNLARSFSRPEPFQLEATREATEDDDVDFH